MHIIATLYHLAFLVVSHIGVVAEILLVVSMIRGAVRTGEVMIGGDMWPELSWTISRSQ